MKEQDNAVVDGFVKNAVEFNLLKYAAGQAIFCPGGGDVMDCRRTVIVTVYGKAKGTKSRRRGGDGGRHAARQRD